MDRIVIRTKCVPGGNSSCNVVSEREGIISKEDMEQRNLGDVVLHQAFKESESYTTLMQKYQQFAETGVSDDFSYAYLLAPRIAVCLDAHITLYKICAMNTLFKWQYADMCVYLTDTWWYQDDEILNDISKISLVEFFAKYW